MTTTIIRHEVTCQECGEIHEANFSHVGGYDTKVNVYEVVCKASGEWISDFYTEEVVREVTVEVPTFEGHDSFEQFLSDNDGVNSEPSTQAEAEGHRGCGCEPDPCLCENEGHFDGRLHPYQRVPAASLLRDLTTHYAGPVGAVCTPCAAWCVREYLTTPKTI